MHFFYLDETGCTGGDLGNPQQPIFVIGGISVRDEGWGKTTNEFNVILSNYFGGSLPSGFELHSHELFNAQGAFDQHCREKINLLVHELIDLVVSRKHAVHFVAIDKPKMAAKLGTGLPVHDVVRVNIPYLIGFNYLVSYIERYIKKNLGATARGMIILDIKDGYHEDIDAITHYRRYEVAQARRLKRLVEFSYPVDSVRHPMIQLSDFIIFILRKFLEIECGHKPDAPEVARKFYAKCFEKILEQVKWSKLINVPGNEEVAAHGLLVASHAKHRPQWKRYYNLG